jgi:hypothetical protein
MRRPRRYLSAGEPIPPGTAPRRVRASTGYMWVWWTVEGVEIWLYEHRFVMGNPAGQIHHLNGVKTDNRRENLEVISTAAAHTQHHNAEKRSYSDDDIVQLYRQGRSTYRIAALLGEDTSVVFRALQRVGEPIRSRSAAARLRRQQEREARA